MPRLRVLASAYAFSPFRGSEPGIGWNTATRLAAYHDVTVLYGDVSRASPARTEIEQFLASTSLPPGMTLQYVAPSALICFLEWCHNLPGLWFLYYLAYKFWQRRAYREAVRLHAARPFDLAHQLTMQGYREPGYLWKLPIPFVWGPVGGASNEPWAFLRSFSWRGRIGVAARNIANMVQMRLALRCRKAARKAARIWAVTDADYRMITELWGAPADRILDTGTTPSPHQQPVHRDPADRLRLVWSGLHISRKALPVLLHAIAQLESHDSIALTVLGEGPETDAWRALADRLRISHLISWKGQLPHAEALSVMAQGHAFAFPSVKEAASTVVLEALQFGMPVICHNACGMGIAVTDECGLKIPLVNPDTSIQGFRAAIERLLNEPDLLPQLSAGAIRRAQQLSWDEKARTIAKAYEEAVRRP